MGEGMLIFVKEEYPAEPRSCAAGALVGRWACQALRYYDEGSGELKGTIPVATMEHVTPGNDSYFTLVSKPLDDKKAPPPPLPTPRALF